MFFKSGGRFMRKIVTLFFLISFFASCARIEKLKKYEIGYDDNYKEYVLYLIGDFKDCKKIKSEIIREDKKIFEKELIGGINDVAINIPLNNLQPGLNKLILYCDEKKDNTEVSIWHFKSPILRYIFTDTFQNNFITPEVEELMETELFIKELKDYILAKEDNFKKASGLYPFLDSKNRINLLIEAAKVYNSKESSDIVLENLKELLFDDDALKLAEAMFSKKDSHIDLEVFNILMSRPEKRIYNKFFAFFLERPHLKTTIFNKLLEDRESEFFWAALNYIKDRIRKEGLKDGYLKRFADIYFYYNPMEQDFIVELLKNRDRYSDGIYLLEMNGVDDGLGKKLIVGYEAYNKDTKLYILKRALPVIDNDENVLAKILGEKDPDFIEYQMTFLNRFDNRYEEKYWSFVKGLIDKKILTHEVESYVNRAPKEIKDVGLVMIYNIRKDFYSLSSLREVDPKFYEEKILEIAKGRRGDYLSAIKILSGYGEKYFDLLIDSYKQAKDINERKAILENILNMGNRGYDFVFNLVMKKPYDKSYIGLYYWLAHNAEGEYLSQIIKELSNFPKGVFSDIATGLQDGQKKIQCEETLGKLFDEKEDIEEIINVGWMWAYCCPKEYPKYLERVTKKYLERETIILESLDGIVDVVRDLNTDIKKEGVSFAKLVEDRLSTKRIRDRVAIIVSSFGEKEDREFLEKIVKKAEDDEERDGLLTYLSDFKERLKIIDENK